MSHPVGLGCVALFVAALPAAAQPSSTSGAPLYAPVLAGQPLSFPADHGAHPEYRTEWWYITGWLDTPRGPEGFQVTFFRSRPQVDQRNPSAFSARQVLFAHAAISDPRAGVLLHDQRIAREGFGLAEASTADMDITLDDWRLRRTLDGRFFAKAGGKAFTLNLAFTPTQQILVEGDGGYSRKGPSPSEASHYYSIPHLAVSGSVQRGGRTIKVKGEAWLDREWSSNVLDPRAVGWDWTGLNLKDGGALMAFQVRDAAGKPLWAGGTLRTPDGGIVRFKPADVSFQTLRRWRSPRTGANYPVDQVLTVRLPSGPRRFALSPLFDDQELDSRAGGGPIYWEGAVRSDSGLGYLELTGYASKLNL